MGDSKSCFVSGVVEVSKCSQFARVVKGVDLRSTAGNCAWVRTPQLTLLTLLPWFLYGDVCSLRLALFTLAAIAQLGERQTEDLEVPGSIPGLGIF